LDYMLDETSFQQVQNGIPTGQTLQIDPASPLFLNNGRGLAAYTHNDVLYQAYLTAYLVLNSVNSISCAIKDNPAPLNPGNPYKTSNTQNGFNTFGQPDIAATLTSVADAALKAVWFQKWYVHLRHRPESGGALVHLIKSGKGPTVQGHPSATVVNSNAVQASF